MKKKIDAEGLTNWRVASKTRPIKAKPLISLLVDRTVASKFLVDTLEGKEPLGDGVVICMGEAGDAWQQMPKKLLAKYAVTSIDAEGWMECQPLPDNAVDVIEVDSAQCDADGSFYIIGQWGATIGDEKNVQIGTAGDFICRNRTDQSDIWIVRRKLFLNTYNIKS
jgi:hypothetical protein